MGLIIVAQLVVTRIVSPKILGLRLLGAIVSLLSENMVAEFGMIYERCDAFPFLLVRMSDSVDLELDYLPAGERRFRHCFAYAVKVFAIRIGDTFCKFMAMARV